MSNRFTMIEEVHFVCQRSKKKYVRSRNIIYMTFLAKNDKEINVTMKAWLSSNFEMKEFGEANFVLGVKILKGPSKEIFSICSRNLL